MTADTLTIAYTPEQLLLGACFWLVLFAVVIGLCLRDAERTDGRDKPASGQHR